MNNPPPAARRDLEFFPVQHQGQQFVLIRDHLDLVEEGKAVGLPLYRLMTLLDGTTTVRDLQMELMREQGGVLVGADEINNLLVHLDESFLLDSDRFREARARIVADFTSRRTRPCSHCGKSYPENPLDLRNRLDEIVGSQPDFPEPEGRLSALVAPHIDLNVGYRGYSRAYRLLKHTSSSRVIILGVGHQLQDALFSLTDKDFETPLGTVRSDQTQVALFRDAGRHSIASDDFIHRSEHSIEFQVIFLQHLLKDRPFTIIPILCGSLQSCLSQHTREAYRDRAGPFLDRLKQTLADPDEETIVVAGVDLSHTGPKFGHDTPAIQMEYSSREHDQRLLEYLTRLDADSFWEESGRVKDRFNVCGFSALSCLLEVLPPCVGRVLHYEIWHEEPTRSAVSFASLAFFMTGDAAGREHDR